MESSLLVERIQAVYDLWCQQEVSELAWPRCNLTQPSYPNLATGALRLFQVQAQQRNSGEELDSDVLSVQFESGLFCSVGKLSHSLSLLLSTSEL